MYKETTQDLCQACETNKARISSYAIINMRLCPECYKSQYKIIEQVRGKILAKVARIIHKLDIAEVNVIFNRCNSCKPIINIKPNRKYL